MNIKYGKRFIVKSSRELLAEFVQRVMSEREWSTYQVADRCGISNTTVWNIANAQNKDVGIETLRALSKGLDVPFRELLRVASGAWPQDEEDFVASRLFVLHQKIRHASPRTKEFIDELIETGFRRLEADEKKQAS